MRIALLLLAAVSLSYPAMADPSIKGCVPSSGDPECQPLTKVPPDPLKGLKWGVALVYSDQKGGVGEVVKGSDNVVRVKKQNQAAARGAFELHYFLKNNNSFLPFGYGPFVSLNTKPVDNLSGGNFFSSVGVGLMVGVDALNGSAGDSINFGVGYLIDTDVKELAPGVAVGSTTTLDPGELTNSTTKGGFMAILSYKLNLN